MNRTIEVRCPYCGAKSKVSVNSFYNTCEVVICDVMAGGCDRRFVADVQVRITAKVLKIEGEEQELDKPLTLDELHQMDMEKVWDNFLMEWCVVRTALREGKGAVEYFEGGFNPLSEKRFYRRKPEEG